MVLVPLDHLPERLKLSLVDTHEPGFLDNIHPEGIADVQKSRRGWIMGGPDGIETVFLQLADPVFVKGIGNSRPYSRMVLMEVAAPEPYRNPINQDSLFGIGLYLRQTSFRLGGRFADCQPNMAVYSGALIEPTFLKGGVRPYGDDVLSAVFKIRSNVVSG